jgi:hypothetical protein
VIRPRQEERAGTGTTSPRALAGRRVEVGLSYRHLVAVETGREPLPTDCADLGCLLSVPCEWLARCLSATPQDEHDRRAHDHRGK